MREEGKPLTTEDTMAKDWMYVAVGVVGFGVIIWLAFAIMGTFWPSSSDPFGLGCMG